ncbi:MAG: MFS transporter, partial [Chlamydiia bacterium]|nr:MFS transporter [Chlamydiia bacterium]
TTWWTNDPNHIYLMLINTVFVGIGYAGLWLMLPSMQADVVDYDELKTGERREGGFSSVYSWVLKLSFMAGFLISGPLLELTGFDAETINTISPEELDAVYTNMRIGYMVIPIFSLTVALIFLSKFPITAKKAQEIRVQLEERRGKV